ncbi:MAG: hypothetical protein H7Y42_01375 [Chitinophagaceae bacterium]|nr:hypothetical protein [Chitinophagaceae bacterium]
MRHITKFAWMLSIGLFFAGCTKDSSVEEEIVSAQSTSPDLYGRYRGTFVRTGLDTAEVRFFFKNDGTYDGSSSSPRYPYICAGTFSENGKTLIVEDTCSWTADFDWTLIFDGTWNISHESDIKVRIWRTNGDITDEYVLTKLVK